jgi:hypothetical protein
MPPDVTAVAEQAVTAAHELARLTRPAITTLDVSELRTLTAALADLAAGLPQTLHQLSRYLHTDGLTATDGQITGDPDTAIGHAAAGLRHAGAAAAHLAAALDAAHQALGDLAENTEPTPEGVKFQPTKRGQISTGVDTTDQVADQSRLRSITIIRHQGCDLRFYLSG